MSKRNDLPQYLTRQEVAKVLRLGTRQVDRLVRQGELHKTKLSASRSGIPRDDLERYLAQRQGNENFYGSPCTVRVLYLPRSDRELGHAVGAAIDTALAKVLPGCMVTVNGKRVAIMVPASAGHSPEDVEREIQKIIGDE